MGALLVGDLISFFQFYFPIALNLEFKLIFKQKISNMKKMLLMAAVFLGIFVSVQAQDSPLKEYLGKYTFAEGSPVTEVVLTLQDSVLVSTTLFPPLLNTTKAS
jgi:hypothetical protein